MRSSLVAALALAAEASDLTCGQVKDVYRSNSCCGADGATALASPTCTYESPLEQMRAFVGDWGQCIDIGLAWQVQRFENTTTGARRPYASYIPYGDVTVADMERVCGGVADNAVMLFTYTTADGTAPNPANQEIRDILKPTTTPLYNVAVLGGMFLDDPALTLADVGVVDNDSPGTRWAKYYGYFWWRSNMSSVTHPFVPYGAQLGPVVDANTGITFDGMIEGKGTCVHHRAVTHMSTLGGPTGNSAIAYLNYRWYFNMTSTGRMKMAYLYHVNYWTQDIAVPDLPGIAPL